MELIEHTFVRKSDEMNIVGKGTRLHCGGKKWVPFDVIGKEKQVLWHCQLQINKSFNIVHYKITSHLASFARK